MEMLIWIQTIKDLNDSKNSYEKMEKYVGEDNDEK